MTTEHHCIVCGDEFAPPPCGCPGCVAVCPNSACYGDWAAVRHMEVKNGDSLFPTWVFNCPRCPMKIPTLGLRETAEQAAWTHLDSHAW